MLARLSACGEDSTMPRSKSVLKRQRQSETRRVRNKSVRSALRTAEKRARTSAGDEAVQPLRQAQRALDKAAAKGVIHPNKAARKKSRLARALNKSSG
jgi:small subunit ribosomal protein S20